MDQNLRLNKHGKPFVRQGFSQLIHTMREAFKACQTRGTRCLIHLEFQGTEREGGTFEVLEKPTRTGENCTARVQKEGSETPFTLSWTPTTEHEITWTRRKSTRTTSKAPGQKAVELIEEFLALEETPVSQEVFQSEEVIPVQEEEEVLPSPAPVVRDQSPSLVVQTREDRIAMLKAAHARVQASRASNAA